EADNTDSGLVLPPAKFSGIENLATNTNLLYPIIAELRVFKTDDELELMRYASKIGSDAHKSVMKTVKPGIYEYQLESMFRHTSYFNGGCRHLGYTCIAAW
uniref:Peptidase M24 domain-containing protein n=1 Tax=Plectus sambesii TaxID=2011161 RepID=A0A914VA51_9BILA